MERIEVKLTEAGKAILGTSEDWVALTLNATEIKEESLIRLSKDIESLNVENQILLEGAVPFTVPRCRVNDAAFLPFSNPLTLNNRTVSLECRVQKGVVQLSYNLIYYRAQNAQGWELEFRTSNDHWALLSSNKRLCTIALPTPTGLTKTIGIGVVDDWDAPAYQETKVVSGITVPGAVDRWVPLDFGGWVDLAEPQQLTDPPQKQVFIEDLRPVFSETALLKKGFCEIGWNLEGKIFETEEARRMWAYLIDPLYYLKSKGGNHKLVGSRNPVADQISGGDYNVVVLGSIDYDPGTNKALRPLSATRWGAGLKNTLPYKARYKFCFSGNVWNSGGISGTVTFGAQVFTTVDTGEFVVQDGFSMELAAGETKLASFCFDVDIEKDQIVLLSFLGDPAGNIVLKTGFRFTAEPNQQSLVRGDVVKLNELINCKYFLLDLFKGFLHKVNGLIQTDFITHTITVFPANDSILRGETVAGFVKADEPIDITNLIICESIKVTPLRSTQNKYSRYSFSPSTDAYIESLKLAEPAHSRKLLNGLELKDTVTEIQNPFFEPTIERQSDVLKRRFVQSENAPYYLQVPFLSVLADNVSGERSTAIGPRTLYAVGKSRQTNPTDGTPATLYFEGVATPNFLYLTQRNTWFVRLVDSTPGNPARLVYGTLEGDLFSAFYLGSSLASKWGNQIEALVLMTEDHFQSWDFRRPFIFNYEGWSITSQGTKITDLAPPLSTPMTFMVPPSETECCDLPCACRFIECLYYQDLGSFISQEMMDLLTITSFKIEGKEVLTAPVGLGILNAVGVGGTSYITNLVDALNSIGAPFFTFNYSGMVYPSKNEGRFFKVKKPVCHTFEILISTSGEVIYRYTDTLQTQSVFGSAQPFGYAAEYSVPTECVLTTEY